MTADLIVLPTNEPLRLNNCTCLYCGNEPTNDDRHTVEHVIGRRFVPRGSLHQSWSLIANACKRCNTRKSNLEDDISAITLLPSLGERHDDPALEAEAKRKAAGSYSRRTRKPVADSHEGHAIEGTIMGSLHVSFSLTSPPQLDEERVHQLARFHLQAFFYMMSFDEQTGRGGFLPGEIGFVARANKADWGNETMRGFGELIAPWSLHLDGNCANGFFKIRMRRQADDVLLWAFALEWNVSHRVVGFFDDIALAQKHVDALPDLKWEKHDATTRYRREVTSEPETDILFASSS